MAVPKRKMSRSNTRSRRAQWKTTVVPTVVCVNPACREPHLQHTACPSCGQYGPRAARRQVLEV
ncbi:MAG: 50S ribosomal protein L32 [Arachnia sp.]